MKSTLLLAISSLLLFSACSEEDGSDPFVDERLKFLGTWSCKETIGTSTMTFPIIITSYGESDSVRISNFSNYGNNAVALGLISGKSIVIPNQQIGITNIVVQGSGLYSSQGASEKITMNYISDGQNATAVCTK
ncbi:MAG: hypothetical protein JNL88_03235 [Bacteroidia bacterium]|nr:hypothetical protein [Bacteroidia bacterium]